MNLLRYITPLLAVSAIVFFAAGPSTSARACAAHSAEANQAPTMGSPRLVSTRSAKDFGATLNALKAAIDTRGLKTFAIVDHAAGAASINMDLRPTTLIIFGNPRGGTPILQLDQRMGIVLPLKAVVYQDSAGDVHVATTDIEAEAAAFDLPAEPGIARISGALTAIRADATKP